MEQVALLFYNIGGAIVANAPVLVGFILPPFVEVLNRDIKNSTGRHIVAVLVCFAVSIVLHWNHIAYGTPAEVALFAGLIFTESQTIYKLYFEKSWLRAIIQEKVGSRVGMPQAELTAPPTQEPLG